MELKVELEVLSALCVGSTADVQGVGVDKATARDADGKLVIPGSTLKGRLRWECERIARALGWAICDAPLSERMCPYRRDEQDKRIEGYCDICEIFGTSGKRSALRFNDAILKADERLRDTPILKRGEPVNTRRPFDAQIRPGVSISRARRVAFTERLFFTETSAPNAGFRFEATIEGEDLNRKQRALVLAGLRALSLVGGGRSRGLGWVRVTRCLLDDVELTNERWSEFIKPLEEVSV